MTDGMDIGYVLKTEKNERFWIFNTELNQQTRQEYMLEEDNKYYNPKGSDLFLGKYKVAYSINGNRNIKKIANPINLINWLIFTMKDIF